MEFNLFLYVIQVSVDVQVLSNRLFVMMMVISLVRLNVVLILFLVNMVVVKSVKLSSIIEVDIRFLWLFLGILFSGQFDGCMIQFQCKVGKGYRVCLFDDIYFFGIFMVDVVYGLMQLLIGFFLVQCVLNCLVIKRSVGF